jgi:hypothetical protein
MADKAIGKAESKDSAFYYQEIVRDIRLQECLHYFPDTGGEP